MIGYTAPSPAVYSVGYGELASSVGQGIGAGAAAAYMAYQLATAKGLRAVDYITGAYGVAGAVLANVPVVGPMLQTYSLVVGGAQYLNDSMKAKRKKDRIKRAIRGIESSYASSVARGYPGELAAYIAARNAGPRTQATLGILDPVARNPYNPRAPVQSGGAPVLSPRVAGLTRAQQYALGPWVVDPDTGELVRERELVARYGQAERDLKTQYELATRIAPARGYVPALLARSHA